MQRLALVTAHEALEMAGFVPNRTPSSMLERVGTFYGQTSDDYREMNAAQAIDTYFITGGIRAFGPVSSQDSAPSYADIVSPCLGSHQLSLQIQGTKLQH